MYVCANEQTYIYSSHWSLTWIVNVAVSGLAGVPGIVGGVGIVSRSRSRMDAKSGCWQDVKSASAARVKTLVGMV